MNLRQRVVKRLGWRPDHPDQRDLVYKPTSSKPLPKVVDLRGNFQWSVFDQGDLGSCTANAISAAVVFTEQKEGSLDKTPSTIPSRLFIYWWERFLENSVGSDSGAEIRDGLKAVSKSGYVDEAQWPYDISKFTVTPPEVKSPEHVTVYKRVTNSIVSMKRCLAAGYPFVFGITVYTSFMSTRSGEIPLPTKSEGVEGGHALLCMGYDNSTKRFLFLNSWGSSWGKLGYGTIPYHYLSDPDLGGDYWTIRRET